MPLLLLELRPKATVTSGLLLGFLAWSALSLAWTPNLWDGLQGLWKWVLLVACFAVGSSAKGSDRLMLGFAWGLGVSVIIALAQLSGWDEIGRSTSIPTGLWVNRNMMAHAAALALIWCVAEGRWFAAIAPACCALLAHGRAAWTALGFVGLVWVWQRSRSTAVACGMIGAVLAALSVPWSPVPQGQETWLDAKRANAWERIVIWRDTMDGWTWLGRGTGSFYSTYPEKASRFDLLAYRPDHAHSEPIEIVFEQGPLGLALLAGFFGLVLWHGRASARAVVLGGLVIALVDFPLRNPASLALVGLMAGVACRDRRRAWQPPVDWRGLVLRWSNAGRERGGCDREAGASRSNLSARLAVPPGRGRPPNRAHHQDSNRGSAGT